MTKPNREGACVIDRTVQILLAFCYLCLKGLRKDCCLLLYSFTRLLPTP